MENGDTKIIQYLREAHAYELKLTRTLEAHIPVAEGEYRKRLEAHLRETRSHADRIRRRLDKLGWTKSPVEVGAGVVQGLLTQGMALAKGPVDMVRGRSVEEKMLKNARDEVMTEALEIATYDAIERLAMNVGDRETAELAASIRGDEERMLGFLRTQIPELTDRVVQSQIPSFERVVVDPDELPIARYDSLTVEELLPRLRKLSDADLAKIREYEKGHKNRSSVLQATEREPVGA